MTQDDARGIAKRLPWLSTLRIGALVEIEGRAVQTVQAGAVRSARWFGPIGRVLQGQRLSSFREAEPFRDRRCIFKSFGGDGD